MVRTRFAPSPTGYMHLGNLRTALYTYLYARKNGGKFVLRIEDTDQGRYVDGAVEMIYRSLSCAGINHDEGPDIGGDFGPYVQSERKGENVYMKAAEELVRLGKAYYCFCDESRLEQLRKEQGAEFKYDKHCVNLTSTEIDQSMKAGKPYVIRINMPNVGNISFHDEVFGKISARYHDLDDMILIKSDGMPTYNFANVIDDHLMGITHVLRGSEYLSSTPKYNYIYKCFGWTPPTYVHLPPVDVIDSNGERRKMSKRKGDPSFEDLLKQGFLPQAIINYIALLGWNPGTAQEIFTLKELESAFHTKGINKAGAIFDTVKLRWFNRHYIQKMSDDEFYDYIAPHLPEQVKGMDAHRIAQLLKSRIETFEDVKGMLNYLFAYDVPSYAMLLNEKYALRQRTDVMHTLSAAKESLIKRTTWTEDSIKEAALEIAEGSPMKIGYFLWPLRVAITGQHSSPGGFYENAYLLGKEETLRRLTLTYKSLM